MNIVITGASSGIGFQAVLHLLKDEENLVVAIARTEEKLKVLEQAAAECGYAEQLFTLPFNINTGNYRSQLHSFITMHMKHVDVLINNAGELINKPFVQTAIEEVEQMLESNFTGHVKMIQAMLPYMKYGGHIVNIGSMGSYQGSVKFAGLSAYSASKAALHTLTECLALELADKQIKVNCLALGSTQTDMLEKAISTIISPTSAEDMGRYIADFALTGHRFFNGKVLPVSVVTP
jgi:short-subunit dehydrogenase